MTKFLAVLLFAALPILAHAGNLEGVDFAEQTNVDGKPLVLNGMGLRTATIFKVKVYASGLYVSSKSHSGEEILGAPGPKKIQMIWMRDVGAKDIQNTWKDILEESCGDGCKTERAKLLSLMIDVKKGDEMDFIFHGDRVEITNAGKSLGAIDGAEFSKQVLGAWIGDKVKLQDLKKGLLGTLN